MKITRYSLLMGFLSVGLMASVAVFIVERLRTITSPFEIVYGEGLLWYQSHLLFNGESLYQTVTSTEYLIIPHTPLFVIVCSWFSWIFGDSLVVGRALSLMSGLGLCVVVYLITRRLTGNPIVSLLAGLLVVTTYVFRFLVPMYRMDPMGLLLSITGIYLFIRFETRGKLVYWAVPLFVLAFLTKQTFFIAPISVCAYLLVKDRWKFASSLKFGGLYLGLLGCSLLVGGLLTNWEMIVHNFLYMGGDTLAEWNWPHYLINLEYLFTWHIPLLLGVLIYFGYRIFYRRSILLVDIYFLGGWAIVLVLLGKLGGGFHYGFEMLVTGCILVGVLMDKVFQVFKDRQPDLKLVGLGAVVFLLVCFQVLGFPFGWNFFTYEYLSTNEAGMGELVSKIQEVEGPVFAYIFATPMEIAGEIDEWTAWEYPLLFVGKAYEREGRLGWDQTDMVEKLNTGYYELAVFEYDLEVVWFNSPDVYWIGICRERLSLEVATALLENFKPILLTQPVGTNRFPMRYFVYQYDGIGVIDYEKGVQIQQ